MSEMTEKVIAVTGAGSGIGRATALGFAEDGALVVASDVDEAGLEQTRAAAAALGLEVVTQPVDVTRRADVESLVARCLTLGGMDVMVANAGVSLDRPFLEVTESELDTTLGVNLKGTFFCGQAAARAMRDLGRLGSIINVASTYAEAGAADCSAYCASKGGVRMLTKVMALELGRYGIRVNAVAPGFIRTAMNPMEDASEVGELEEAIPLARIGSPDDVAKVIRWLATDAAGYVSGEMVFVDGGWIVQ